MVGLPHVQRRKRAVMLDVVYPVPVSDKSNAGHMATSDCAPLGCFMTLFFSTRDKECNGIHLFNTV